MPDKELKIKIKGIKGEDGYSPIKNKDYFDGKDGETPTKETLEKIIKPLIPKPIKGDDYVLTSKDKKEIASSIKVPILEKVIEKTEVIKEVALKDTPKQVKEKLLKEGLDYSEVQNTPDIPALVNKINLEVPIIVRNLTKDISSKTYNANEIVGLTEYIEEVAPISPTPSLQQVTDNGATTTKTISVAGLAAGNGTALLPSVTFVGNVNTGMYRKTTNTLGFSTAGLERLYISSTGGLVVPTNTVHYFNGQNVFGSTSSTIGERNYGNIFKQASGAGVLGFLALFQGSSDTIGRASISNATLTAGLDLGFGNFGGVTGPDDIFIQNKKDTANGYLWLLDKDLLPTLSLRMGGNLGINTTSEPLEKLEVYVEPLEILQTDYASGSTSTIALSQMPSDVYNSVNMSSGNCAAGFFLWDGSNWSLEGGDGTSVGDYDSGTNTFTTNAFGGDIYDFSYYYKEYATSAKFSEAIRVGQVWFESLALDKPSVEGIDEYYDSKRYIGISGGRKEYTLNDNALTADRIPFTTTNGRLTDSANLLYNGTLLNIIGTSEQLRIAYNASNYYKTTVSSTGLTTFDAVGTGAEFLFSDRVRQPGTFAEIYVADGVTAQSFPTGTTYTKLTAFTTNGSSANCTADATNDKITITKAGKYLVNCVVSGYDGAAGAEFKMALFKAGTEQANIHATNKYNAGSEIDNMEMCGIVVATANQDIDVRLRHGEVGAVNFTTQYANLTINYLGE